jgi:hypothetical protein
MTSLFAEVIEVTPVLANNHEVSIEITLPRGPRADMWRISRWFFAGIGESTTRLATLPLVYEDGVAFMLAHDENFAGRLCQGQCLRCWRKQLGAGLPGPAGLGQSPKKGGESRGYILWRGGWAGVRPGKKRGGCRVANPCRVQGGALAPQAGGSHRLAMNECRTPELPPSLKLWRINVRGDCPCLL